VISLHLKTIYKLGKWIISIGSVLFIFLKLKNASFTEIDLLMKTISLKSNFSVLTLLLFLMFLNWLIEAAKWKIVLQSLQNISIYTSYKSVLAGVAFGIVTPNRIGELVGRILFIDEEKKISASLLNIICSLLQLLVTLIFGASAILFFKEKWLSQIPLLSLFSIAVLILILIFCLFFLIQKNPFLQQNIKEYLLPFKQININKIATIFGLSIFRYLVFTIQYILILRLFGIELGIANTIVCVALNFFLITIIPSYALAEIGIRGTVAVSIFSVYGIATLPVVSASLFIWIINLAIPALAGTIILIKET